MSFFYEGVLRLDWGFGNPNRTAALIVMLMLAAWLAADWRRWGFWLSLALFSILGMCLVQTFSRGGMFALLCGASPLLFFARRPWPLPRIVCIVLAVVALFTYATALSATDRVADSWQGDRSVTNRLELWKHVPAMISDAPGGWGWGQAQNAYMNWYQPVDRTERFLNLTNFHFNVLTEVSWPARWLYFVGWLFALRLAWPRRGVLKTGVPLGVLVAFFVAGLFTHFGDSWPVYVPPFLTVLALLFLAWREKASPSRSAALVIIGASLLACGLLDLTGRLTARLPIQGGRDRVLVGMDPASTWLLVDQKILGDQYGKAFRRFLAENPDARASVGFVRQGTHLPATAGRVVFGSPDLKSLQALAERKPHSLLLLNSRLYPLEIQHFFGPVKVDAYFGEFSRSPSQSAWSEHPTCHLIAGAGEYLPDWPRLLSKQQ